jgi:hypothetical protein
MKIPLDVFENSTPVVPHPDRLLLNPSGSGVRLEQDSKEFRSITARASNGPSKPSAAASIRTNRESSSFNLYPYHRLADADARGVPRTGAFSLALR